MSDLQTFPKDNSESTEKAKNFYSNFVNFATKNTILVIVLMLICFTIISVSAAQIIAPNEYKLSNIFTSKSQNSQSNSQEINSNPNSQQNNISNLSSISNTNSNINLISNSQEKPKINSPFTLSGKGCEPFSTTDKTGGLKCSVMENGKEIEVLRNCNPGFISKCLVGIEQGVKSDNYQYFYSNAYETSGIYVYPFNIKSRKMDKEFVLTDPCNRMGIASLEYKNCFESQKTKQYNQDYLKYTGQKPKIYLPDNAGEDFVNVVYTLVKKDGATLYWTSDLVCQSDSTCVTYATSQDFRTPEDIKSNQMGVKYEFSGSSKRNDKDENRTFTKTEKTQKVAAINGETFTFYGLNITVDKTLVNWTKDSECPPSSSACKLYSSRVNFLTKEESNSTEKVKYNLWGSSKKIDDSEVSIELTKWLKIENNTQKSIQNSTANPQIKPLVADSEHDVLVLEECDLVVRFKKDKDYRASITKENYLNEAEFNKFVVGFPQSGKLSTLIYCNNQAQIFDKLKELENKNDLININQSEFCKNIKLNSSSCNQITKYIAYKDPTSQFPDRYYFVKGNFLYIITSNYYDEIQFNSLSPSTPSVKL